MSNTIRATFDPQTIANPERWRLHVVASPDALSAGRIIELHDGKTFLGRSAGAGPSAVTIEDQRLSRRHAALNVDGQTLEVEDLQSSNGSWIRGKRIHKQTVDHGAVLRIGNTVLVAEFDRGAASGFVGSIPGVPGGSEIARSLRAQISELARTDETVLLFGPRGVGKAKMAREIHRQSGRTGSKVAVRIDNFDADEALDLLFGGGKHETGLLLKAGGGTLIIERIDHMSPTLQHSLCGLFADAGRLQDLQARVVALSERPLLELVDTGEFDGELADALSRNMIVMPGLSARRADLILLADAVVPLTDFRHADTWASVLDADSAEMLLHYSWPENLEELHRVLTPLVQTMGQGGCTVDDLPPALVRSVKDSLHGRRPERSAAAATPSARPRYTPVQLCHLVAVHGGIPQMAKGLGYSEHELLQMFRNAGQ